jgi:hypothetical protein
MFLFRAAIRDVQTGERIDVSSRKEARRISRLLNDADRGILPCPAREKPFLARYVVVQHPAQNWVMRVHSSVYATGVARASTHELAGRIAELLNRVDPVGPSRDPARAFSRAEGSVQYLWESLRRRG